MVRTPGFHPGNPGSIPGEITKVKSSVRKDWAFYFDEFIRGELNPTRSHSVKSIDFTESS